MCKEPTGDACGCACANAPLKVGVLISGSGSNLQAIIDAIGAGKLNAQVACVVSSRPDAYGLERAKQAGIPTLALDRATYADRLAADRLIVQTLQDAGVEYVAMAGYMRMVTDVILDAYPNRVINLHPALLPSFKGAHAIEEAFEYGVKVTGVTVHFADQTYDTGAIIAQEPVVVREDDTLESLEERIHATEHELYPRVLQLVAQGKVAVEDGRVKVG